MAASLTRRYEHHKEIGVERDSLILYAKIEALFFQVYPTFKSYPKSETHGLCRRIKDMFISLLEAVGQAKEVASKRKLYLQQAAGYIQNIVSMFRLSRHQRYISRGFFEQLDIKITEIKKILVGFMRSVGRTRQAP